MISIDSVYMDILVYAYMMLYILLYIAISNAYIGLRLGVIQLGQHANKGRSVKRK